MKNDSITYPFVGILTDRILKTPSIRDKNADDLPVIKVGGSECLGKEFSTSNYELSFDHFDVHSGGVVIVLEKISRLYSDGLATGYDHAYDDVFIVFDSSTLKTGWIWTYEVTPIVSME
jgi:hypothetical protein